MRESSVSVSGVTIANGGATMSRSRALAVAFLAATSLALTACGGGAASEVAQSAASRMWISSLAPNATGLPFMLVERSA